MPKSRANMTKQTRHLCNKVVKWYNVCLIILVGCSPYRLVWRNACAPSSSWHCMISTANKHKLSQATIYMYRSSLLYKTTPARYVTM